MQKVRREISSNLKLGIEFQEYDKNIYHCKKCDVWVNTEVPVAVENKWRKF